MEQFFVSTRKFSLITTWTRVRTTEEMFSTSFFSPITTCLFLTRASTFFALFLKIKLHLIFILVTLIVHLSSTGYHKLSRVHKGHTNSFKCVGSHRQFYLTVLQNNLPYAYKLDHDEVMLPLCISAFSKRQCDKTVIHFAVIRHRMEFIHP